MALRANKFVFLDFSLKTKIALAEINKERNQTYKYLKHLQVQAVKSALGGETLVVLPTGYGKSLVYELIPKMTNQNVIVVSPLNSIISEQVAKIGKRAIWITDTVLSDLAWNGKSFTVDSSFS